MLYRAAEDGFWPENVFAMYSDRHGGISRPPYDSFNLGDHVGDSSASVKENRERLLASLKGCDTLQWLQQVHGTQVFRVDKVCVSERPEADASMTSEAGVGLVVMTADCLPVLISDASGRQLAAVHAGWRGLLDGVIESAIDAFDASADQLRVWMGPCIGPRQFEVGVEVRDAFLAHSSSSAEVEACFEASANGRYLADLKALAQLRLHRCGVSRISVNQECTVEQADRYFSYRRDGQCGRMVSLIYRV